jgi:hypothetical protein
MKNLPTLPLALGRSRKGGEGELTARKQCYGMEKLTILNPALLLSGGLVPF